MKVECIAIVKNYASADVRAQQIAEDAFQQLGAQVAPFRVLDDTKSFFGEMREMFRRADVIVAAADEGAFLEQKWNMLKALGLKSEICPAVISVIRQEVSAPDASAKAHALMPKNAAVFLTSDGLYSGFAMRSGMQTLLYLPLEAGRMQEIVANGVTAYFSQHTAAEKPQPETKPAQPAPVQLDIPDNNERFAETADLLSARNLTVAFASTETNVFIQNGVRSNPTFGESFIPAVTKDDPSSRASVMERIACLADAARKEIGTSLGAAISNIYSVGMDSKEMFLNVALTDGEYANVRKITAQPGMSTGDLVALATDTLYTMLQDYADGEAFPPDDANVKPLKLYEESAQAAQANQKRKRSTAIQIAVCIVIALILCVLIGFYFKDEVAAFFDGVHTTDAAAAVVQVEDPTEPLTEWFVQEAETEPETEASYEAVDVDLSLFGTADPAEEAVRQTAAFIETPAPQSYGLDVKPYVASVVKAA
ncbi:MAG: hypothetical protein IKW76_00795, partial [Clostridia bacterium]|nr:hypothetical protein [Clostridia bacterium]